MAHADGVGRQRQVREERPTCTHVAHQRLAGSLAALLWVSDRAHHSTRVSIRQLYTACSCKGATSARLQAHERMHATCAVRV